jgi:hypothetical protein
VHLVSSHRREHRPELRHGLATDARCYLGYSRLIVACVAATSALRASQLPANSYCVCVFYFQKTILSLENPSKSNFPLKNIIPFPGFL